MLKAKFNAEEWSYLSPQQATAIQWVLEGTGSLELMARAGCGKTFFLMEAIKAIVKANYGNMALMAYNSKIAGELKDKIAKAGYDWKIAQAGTCHSFGLSVWKQVAGKDIPIDANKLHNIIDNLIKNGDEIIGDYAEVVAKLCSLGKQRAIGHLCSIDDDQEWYSIWEHFNLENDVSEDTDPSTIISLAKKLYRISLDQCKQVIDFDDMILAPLYFRARFWPKDWVMLDESQDTNPARRALALAMLKPKTGRMIFVGDIKQAIYGFTGADSDSMEQLKKATNAITLPLNETRRCPKNVVKEAQKYVPDITAYSENIGGEVRTLDVNFIQYEKLGKDDAILCRNTAPLITMAYTLISNGIACKVEGREIGTNLIKLATRWKIKTLDALINKLDDFQARQTAKFMSKNQEEKVEGLVDQIDCLRVVINKCLLAKKYTIADLIADVENMFGNTPEGEQPKVLTLSTVHRSKGREWLRVYILDMDKYMPSPYAKKQWQQEQEVNLIYVAITRAMRELIYVYTPEVKG
jgi:superfamily I DNA/RNA helicase